MTPEDIDSLSDEFSKLIREEIGNKNMREVVRVNHREKDRDVCHTHTFTDPNMIMAEAWENCFESEMDLTDPAHLDGFNEAWAISKIHDFGVNPRA